MEGWKRAIQLYLCFCHWCGISAKNCVSLGIIVCHVPCAMTNNKWFPHQLQFSESLPGSHPVLNSIKNVIKGWAHLQSTKKNSRWNLWWLTPHLPTLTFFSNPQLYIGWNEITWWISEVLIIVFPKSHNMQSWKKIIKEKRDTQVIVQISTSRSVHVCKPTATYKYICLNRW